MTSTTQPTIEDRIEQLTPIFYNIARRYSTPEVPEDDIYQGIVLKVLSSCKPTDTRSFICQCATWHAKNMLNLERIYSQYVTLCYEDTIEDGEPYDIIELSVSNEPDPEELVLLREIDSIICEIMANVNEKNRVIISMLAQGETHQSIADRMQVSRSAVTNRVHDIRGVFCMAGLVSV